GRGRSRGAGRSARPTARPACRPGNRPGRSRSCGGRGGGVGGTGRPDAGSEPWQLGGEEARGERENEGNRGGFRRRDSGKGGARTGERRGNEEVKAEAGKRRADRNLLPIRELPRRRAWDGRAEASEVEWVQVD